MGGIYEFAAFRLSSPLSRPTPRGWSPDCKVSRVESGELACDRRRQFEKDAQSFAEGLHIPQAPLRLLQPRWGQAEENAGCH